MTSIIGKSKSSLLKFKFGAPIVRILGFMVYGLRLSHASSASRRTQARNSPWQSHGRALNGVAMNARVRQQVRRWCSTSAEPSLISWVRDQGGRVGSLQLHDNLREGYGLTTTDAVRAGETLIALPPHLPLSVQTQDPVLLALFDRIPGNWHLSVVDAFSSEDACMSLSLRFGQRSCGP